MRLLLLLLLCGSCAANATEFSVRCPRCATTQRLTPSALTVIGSVRTDGGFLDERTLKFRCAQRQCRHRFTASNTVFRAEVVAIALPPALGQIASRAKHP